MTSRFVIRILPLFHILFACFVMSITAAAAVDDLVTEAKEHLQNDRFLEALASAKDALRAAPEDYRAHYYVAMAYLGLEQYDDAEWAAQQSRELAPAEAKPAVEKLEAVIKSRTVGAGMRQLADTALAQGLAGKAARFYEEGWNAVQDDPELGLKAADLYANRLDQPVDAGRVLRQVIQAAKGSPAAATAAAELAKLAATLGQIADDNLAAARIETDYAKQLVALKLAEEAVPAKGEIQEQRARLVAEHGTPEELQQAIKDLARHGLATVDALTFLPKINLRLDDAAFSEFLTDVIGAKQVAELKAAPRKPPVPGKPYVIPGLALKLVPIPAGTFIMGSYSGASDETPHTVTITRGYWLGQNEVSQAEWSAVMDSNPSKYKDKDRPVENVSYEEAMVFCQKLNQREKTAGRLPAGHAYTLPTEAQWEYACRAGTTGDFGGTGKLHEMGWFKDNRGNQRARPGGQKRANAWNLHDMHGNVMEWCSDWYISYPPGSVSDPTGPASGSIHVFRGGSWPHDSYYCTSYVRMGNSGMPGFRHPHLGFRVALSWSGKSQ